MNKDELIKHIQDNATSSDLVRIANILNVEIDEPSNINGKYFHLEGKDSVDYIKIIDSKYIPEDNEYEVNKCVFVSDDHIALYDEDFPILINNECIEITKEKFMEEYNKVLANIQKNL